MTDWPTVRLEDCTQIVSGATPSTSEPAFWDGDIWWVTPKDLSALEGAYLSETPRTITRSGLESCAATILPPESVLFSSRAPIGHVAINTVPMATNQGFKSFVPKRDRVDSKFLYHWLRWNRPQLESLGNGATFKEVSKSVVSRIQIPLPPLPEQRRIAEILDKADGLRVKRRAALAQLDNLTQSIFLDMFGDPATNPKRWPTRPFHEVCETRLGKMLDAKQQTGKHRRPYLRNANLQWFRFDLGNILEMDFDEADREELRLRFGDLLICEGGEPGRAAVWAGELEECYFQKALHRARPNPELATAEYLCWLFWFLAQGNLLTGVTSATIAHLTGEKLALLRTILPPLGLQQTFSQWCEAVQAARAIDLVSLVELDALFASLQHRAFRGEL